VEVQGRQAAWEPALVKVPTAHASPRVDMLVALATVCETLKL
jgi:hypothetical protein